MKKKNNALNQECCFAYDVLNKQEKVFLWLIIPNGESSFFFVFIFIISTKTSNNINL